MIDDVTFLGPEMPTISQKLGQSSIHKLLAPFAAISCLPSNASDFFSGTSYPVDERTPNEILIFDLTTIPLAGFHEGSFVIGR